MKVLLKVILLRKRNKIKREINEAQSGYITGRNIQFENNV